MKGLPLAYTYVECSIKQQHLHCRCKLQLLIILIMMCNQLDQREFNIERRIGLDIMRELVVHCSIHQHQNFTSIRARPQVSVVDTSKQARGKFFLIWGFARFQYHQCMDALSTFNSTATSNMQLIRESSTPSSLNHYQYISSFDQIECSTFCMQSLVYCTMLVLIHTLK